VDVFLLLFEQVVDVQARDLLELHVHHLVCALVTLISLTTSAASVLRVTMVPTVRVRIFLFSFPIFIKIKNKKFLSSFDLF